jgi:hypothetical protein
MQCHLVKLAILTTNWDVNISVENCTKASALNELMLFSANLVLLGLSPSESGFSKDIFAAQFI